MTAHPGPPPVSELTYAQYSGWACCWCGKQLQHGAVSAGISRGREGAHVLDIEVYACPDCAPVLSPQTPARPVPREQQGRAGSTASHRRHTSTTGGIT